MFTTVSFWCVVCVKSKCCGFDITSCTHAHFKELVLTVALVTKDAFHVQIFCIDFNFITYKLNVNSKNCAVVIVKTQQRTKYPLPSKKKKKKKKKGKKETKKEK